MADPPAILDLPLPRRILIMAAVVLASTLYATTLLVASTLLPQMQGSFAATADEIAWTTTFNILATAIVTPMTGFLVARYGRRQVMVGSVSIFTLATYLCGQAESLEAIVAWRILQGGAGAPVVPLANATVLDSFPRNRAGLVSSIFGMTVVLGPVIGPALGGVLAEMYNWRWAFYMIVPAGVIAALGLRFALPPDRPAARTPLDWLGFLSLSISIASLQLVLSRGQRQDWYESLEIIIETGVAGLAFWIFLAHSLTAARPFLDLRLLLDRNYALGLALVFLYGMVNFTPTVLLPSLLQQHAGYPDSIIGLITGYRGIGGTIGFGMTLLIGRWDPRIGMSIGFGILVAQGLWLTQLDLNTGVDVLLANALMQGVGVGVVWVPLTVMTFSGLENRQLAEAMSLFHLLRNIGSSLFISLSVSEILRSGTVNYSRMTEMISPYNEALSLPWVMGGWTMETQAGLARLGREIERQAAMIGYVNAFGMYTAACGVAILLGLLGRKARR
ncbi:DHA2 family efflux MFS transporter permease subunit [Siccirubricoccus sp. KC 17139]|uniref:DHA2 family efflux MFS transporter permease subunit n=1 Tax=Siccirubricoccus soli TaxID=2899147 RepID=A0ABT1DAM1_9PROT|nr:DHA2 family efflux MFS transporter permease subunit [Siccirubricoccus soli]MCO6418987.1 DHA2 family efflux MFS transporter permease subunit [Siccirubricoccus soli]MCP2685122.1 DHA2 family efflux MFS transporter permease subunit [Siccirubricoccus soli]